jgi:integrase
MSGNQIAALKSTIQKTHIVPYLTPDEVYRIVDVAKEGNKGERNSILIKTLFETGLRISEALSITPRYQFFINSICHNNLLLRDIQSEIF